MREVEYCTGKIGKEDYHRSVWHEADLQPKVGYEFELELEGAGYMYHG